MTEKEIQNQIQRELNNGDSRLFRNNVGTVEGKDGRFHHFGLCKGSSDLIGFKTITITADMVGTRKAIFAAVEVKSATGKPSPEQIKFIKFIQQSGGIAGIARSADEAKSILQSPCH